MKLIHLSKHGLTLAALATMIVGWVQLYNLDVAEEHFGKRIISGTFFLSAGVLIAVYRIHWVGRQKVNWISLGLFVLTFAGLLLMLVNPKNVMALWKPTVALFILLSGYTYFLRLNRKNWSAVVAKGLLIITAGLFLFPLLIQTSSRDYFGITWFFLIGTGLFSLLQLFLPERQG